MVVIITDAKYRASLAAVRSLAACGYEIVITQTKAETGANIPAFSSCFVQRTVLFDCSVENEEAYMTALENLVKEYDNPVILPIGAKTLGYLSKRRESFAKICNFLCPCEKALELANDKSAVAALAEKMGINVPHTYMNGENPNKNEFPVIVKPKCGEKFGLTASERYIIANNQEEYIRAYKKMEAYGGDPVVQEKISGVGVGVSLLMVDGKAVSAICHRRVREYPSSGGPSACCESFFDEELVLKSEKLLASINFCGMAMVEYKVKTASDGIIHAENAYILEINPRIWGSFPLTYAAEASFAEDYVLSANGTPPSHPLSNYKTGVKMNFILSDLAAVADLIRHRRILEGIGGIRDILFGRAVDAMRSKADPKPFRNYLKLKILKK